VWKTLFEEGLDVHLAPPVLERLSLALGFYSSFLTPTRSEPSNVFIRPVAKFDWPERGHRLDLSAPDRSYFAVVGTQRGRLLAARYRSTQNQSQIRSTETNFMAFRPLGDRVLVRRVEEEEKTKGGIIIPDTARKSLRKASLWPSGQAPATTRARSSLWT